MTTTAASPRREGAWRETLVMAGLCAVVYAMTWQAALHGTDWRWFVLWLDEPGAVHPQHPGYLLVARALRWLLSPFELSAYGVLRVLSILGGAVAVAGVHRLALAVAGGRGDRVPFARLAAAAAAVSPALWHHATVVELHAAFAAAMIWACLAAVRLARRGRARDAVLTGVLTGLATTLHATGHLLVLVVAAAVVGRATRRLWVFGAVHAAVWGAAFGLARALGRLPADVQGRVETGDGPLGYLLQSWARVDFGAQAWPTVLHEWVQPYAPWSVCCVALLVVGRRRGAAARLHAVLLVYLAVAVTMVQAYTDERGGYLLPLLAPAVLLTAFDLRRRWWPLLFVGALACGVAFRGEPGREPPDRAFGAAAAAMARERPTVFFVADLPEMDGAFLADPRLDLVVGRQAWDELRAAQQRVDFRPTPPQIAAWLALLAREATVGGRRFVVTDRARAWLAERAEGFEEAYALFAQGAGAKPLPAACGIAGQVVE